MTHDNTLKSSLIAASLSEVLKEAFRDISRKGYNYVLGCKNGPIVFEGSTDCDGQLLEYHTELLWMDEFREARLRNEGEVIEEEYHRPKPVAHVAILVTSEQLTVCADVFVHSDDRIAFFNEIYVPTQLPKGIDERRVGWLV